MTLLASVMLLASACTGKQASEKTASGLEPANFRTEVDGKQTDLFVLENKNGMEVCITNFGGRIVSVMVPDKDGVMRDVVLGFDSKTSVSIRDERENGADQIRKPLEGDGIQPQIGEAGCASFFGFAKQNVRPNPGRTRKMMQTK